MIEHYTWFALRTKPQQEGTAQAVLTGHVERVECPKRKRAYGAGPVQPRPVRVPRVRPKPVRRGNGIVVLVPLEEVFRKANGTVKKKRKVTRPLMPGWIIAGFSAQVDWWSVLSVNSVSGVACENGGPKEVRYSQIRCMLSGLPSGIVPAPDYAALMRSRSEYEPGDLCEVAAGPFEGYMVDVQSITGKAARVLVPFLGQRTPADIPLDYLVKVA